MDRNGFAARLLSAPAGVALLAGLEGDHRDDVPSYESPPDSVPAAVLAATAAVETMSFGRLVERSVTAADWIGGPWMSDAPTQLARAFRHASARSPIAAAIAERFALGLHDDLDPDAQQWWASAYEDLGRIPRLSADHGSVYCCGEFTWHGLWTVTDPPVEVHNDLVGVWELYPEPISRWRLPVATTARVREIHDSADWAELVATYPHRVDGRHSGWELPGPNQHLRHVADVEIASRGAAARHDVRVAMPDWTAVAADHDAVHLSWAGMITAEGNIVAVPSLGPDVVTMLRYWRSERTLWLNDVFGRPEPVAAPRLLFEANRGVSVIDDGARRAADERALTAVFSRDPFAPSPRFE